MTLRRVAGTTLRRIGFAAILAFFSSPAFATGEVYCEAPDGSGAAFGYDFGRVPGLAILDATIRADGRVWSIAKADGATQMILAQGAQEAGRTLIDFADVEHSRIIASVRLISASEGDDFVSIGILQVKGVGVFPLICD